MRFSSGELRKIEVLILEAFCFTSLSGGNQVDGLPPVVNSVFKLACERPNRRNLLQLKVWKFSKIEQIFKNLKKSSRKGLGKLYEFFGRKSGWRFTARASRDWASWHLPNERTYFGTELQISKLLNSNKLISKSAIFEQYSMFQTCGMLELAYKQRQWRNFYVRKFWQFSKNEEDFWKFEKSQETLQQALRVLQAEIRLTAYRLR